MATLVYCGHVKRKAAEILGVSLKTLYNRLEAYNVLNNVQFSDIDRTARFDPSAAHRVFLRAAAVHRSGTSMATHTSITSAHGVP